MEFFTKVIILILVGSLIYLVIVEIRDERLERRWHSSEECLKKQKKTKKRLYKY